jgi:hypothetical protein
MKQNKIDQTPATTSKADKVMKSIGSVLVILKEAAMFIRILRDLLS